jgi:hypothetical protein
MNYNKQVEATLANAVPFTFNGIDILPEFLHDTTILTIPPEADDAYPVVLSSRDQLVQPDNSLYVDSPRKVKKIVDSYDRQTRTSTAGNYDLLMQQESMEAVQRLGGSALYSVNFFRDERAANNTGMTTRILDVVPYDWEATKLGYAIQKVYPLRPSQQAEADIRKLGYANRNHVIGLAIEHELPVPLTAPVRRGAAAKFLSAIQRIKR